MIQNYPLSTKIEKEEPKKLSEWIIKSTMITIDIILSTGSTNMFKIRSFIDEERKI